MKICFKCYKAKHESEFYTHKKMGDGLLGKCKQCTKNDSQNRLKLKRLDPVWLAKERARCREKQRKRRGLGLLKQHNESKKTWRIRNRHKTNAQQLARRSMLKGAIKIKTACEDCDAKSVKLHMHHEDYSKPLDVVFLCTKCHGKRHWKDRVKQ